MTNHQKKFQTIIFSQFQFRQDKKKMTQQIYKKNIWLALAGGVRALWISDHPLWRTRYYIHLFPVKLDGSASCPLPPLCVGGEGHLPAGYTGGKVCQERHVTSVHMLNCQLTYTWGCLNKLINKIKMCFFIVKASLTHYYE